MAKIAIIGAGVVGATTAYTLMMRNIASEIILVDINDIKCKGEVYDLTDALSFTSTSIVKQGSLKEAGQCDIAIITAGIPQKPGQTRLELLNTNYKIIQDIIKGMQPINPKAITIVVTNPVDILTHAVQKISGLPKNQIFGSGTMLDTQRLRALIGEKLKIAQQSVHLYTLGEHGDSQFTVWSSANIAGIPIQNFIDPEELKKMQQKAKLKAYDIIECKGSTAFGVAACVSAYCQNIIFDAKRVLPVSCYLKDYDVCISMPVILGNAGIEKILMPLFNENEKRDFENSISTTKEYLAKVK